MIGSAPATAPGQHQAVQRTRHDGGTAGQSKRIQASAQVTVTVGSATWAQASGTKPSEAAVRTDVVDVLRQALQQDVVLTKAGARIAVKPVTVLDSAPEITKSVNAAVFEQIRLSPSPAHGRADEALQQQLAAGKATAVRCGRGGRLVQALGRGGSVDFPPAPAMYADRHGRLTLQAPRLTQLPPDDAWFHAPTEVVALLLFPQLAVLLDGADADVMSGLRRLVA
ncbi:hypothetical protein PYK79_17475 [Streptomyces sp. ID05-04B]|nr:hypothetical protein [Streptomyces sp. ID05-04B]MDX5564801.1 hypothetical protein [Streptomyces sp. ID05-04B]